MNTVNIIKGRCGLCNRLIFKDEFIIDGGGPKGVMHDRCYFAITPRAMEDKRVQMIGPTKMSDPVPRSISGLSPMTEAFKRCNYTMKAEDLIERHGEVVEASERIRRDIQGTAAKIIVVDGMSSISLGKRDDPIRQFDTGANRNSDVGKLDFEGFFSPLVIECYAEYMDKNRSLADGTLRDSDNWQKGIPKDAYVKSAWRHYFDWWSHHRGWGSREGIKAAICGLIFNAMGYLHEILKKERENDQK